MATLVAQGRDENCRPLRVLAEGTRRIIERATKDSLGAPTWSKIADLDLAVTHHDTAATLAATLLHLIDDLAAARDAVADTMNYTKPPNYREG